MCNKMHILEAQMSFKALNADCVPDLCNVLHVDFDVLHAPSVGTIQVIPRKLLNFQKK